MITTGKRQGVLQHNTVQYSCTDCSTMITTGKRLGVLQHNTVQYSHAGAYQRKRS